MDESDAEELTTFVVNRADESLRGVACYSADAVNLTYKREDIPESELRQRVDEIFQNILAAQSTNSTLRQELGRLGASLQVRQHAVIMHFPLAPRTGVLVSLEPEVTRNLYEFVAQCMKRLPENTSR